MMKLCGFAATSAAGSARSPAGLGAWNVPSFSQMSCQRDSISAARAALYRNGAVAVSAAPDAGVVSLMVLKAPSMSVGEPAFRAGDGAGCPDRGPDGAGP